MLRGNRVVLRATEKDDIKRLHELHANVNLVLLGDGSWRPESLAAWASAINVLATPRVLPGPNRGRGTLEGLAPASGGFRPPVRRPSGKGRRTGGKRSADRSRLSAASFI